MRSRIDLSVMREMMAQGSTLRAVAQRFGVTPGRASQVAGEHGLVPRRSRCRALERHHQLIAGVKSGGEWRSVADALGIKHPFARAILHKAGVAYNGAADRHGIFDAENAVALDNIRNGASIRSQADSHAHNLKLQHACKRLGIVSQAHSRGKGKGAIGSEQFLEALRSGAKPKDLALEYGVLVKAIYSRASRHGIALRDDASGASP